MSYKNHIGRMSVKLNEAEVCWNAGPGLAADSANSKGTRRSRAPQRTKEDYGSTWTFRKFLFLTGCYLISGSFLWCGFCLYLSIVRPKNAIAIVWVWARRRPVDSGITAIIMGIV